MRVIRFTLVGLFALMLFAGSAEAEMVHALTSGHVRTFTGNFLGADQSEQLFHDEGKTHAVAGESVSSSFGGATAVASGWGRSWINPLTELLSLQAAASQATSPATGEAPVVPASGYARGGASWLDAIYVPKVQDVLLTFQVTAELSASGSGEGWISAQSGPNTADLFIQSDGNVSVYGWDSYSWDALTGNFSGLVTFRRPISRIEIDDQEWGYGEIELGLLTEASTNTGAMLAGGSSRVESLNSMTLIRIAYADSGLPPEIEGGSVRFESGLISPNVIPEPSSLVLAVFGGFGLLGWRLGRRRGLGGPRGA